MTDVTKLQQELDMANNNVKGLIAQLEASKQFCNELLQSTHHLRTNLILLQQNAQEDAKKKTELQSHIDTLAAQILALTKPKVEEVQAEEVQPDAA